MRLDPGPVLVDFAAVGFVGMVTDEGPIAEQYLRAQGAPKVHLPGQALLLHLFPQGTAAMGLLHVAQQGAPDRVGPKAEHAAPGAEAVDPVREGPARVIYLQVTLPTSQSRAQQRRRRASLTENLDLIAFLGPQWVPTWLSLFIPSFMLLLLRASILALFVTLT